MALTSSALRNRPNLFFLLLVGLLAVLLLAGGASRGDVPGQAVVRTASWGVIAAILLISPRPAPGRPAFLLLLLIAVAAIPLLQLIPLPPSLWQSLPGRHVFADAAALSGQAQPWRPWSIVPNATANAAASLVVPFAVWLLATRLPDKERAWLPAALLAIVLASTLVGLLQFSGASFNNPLVNDTAGEVSGMFANRNHFALFLAMGCLLAPTWGFPDSRLSWRSPVSLGLVILFLMTILASGSRAGLGLGVVALLLGLLLSRQAMKRALARYPKWVLPGIVAGAIAMVAIFVLLSVMADRAVSISRMFAIDQGQDMRSRGLPTLLEMVRTYFPFGTGLGSFDPLFRMHEPYELLKLTYFNHAHNDFLEIVLDAGLPGLMLVLTALGWWAAASMRAWAVGTDKRYALPRLGSAMLFLVILASIFDYPARTPMIMAVMVIAAIWLSARPEGPQGSPLPRKGQHL